MCRVRRPPPSTCPPCGLPAASLPAAPSLPCGTLAFPLPSWRSRYLSLRRNYFFWRRYGRRDDQPCLVYLHALSIVAAAASIHWLMWPVYSLAHLARLFTGSRGSSLWLHRYDALIDRGIPARFVRRGEPVPALPACGRVCSVLLTLFLSSAILFAPPSSSPHVSAPSVEEEDRTKKQQQQQERGTAPHADDAEAGNPSASTSSTSTSSPRSARSTRGTRSTSSCSSSGHPQHGGMRAGSAGGWRCGALVASPAMCRDQTDDQPLSNAACVSPLWLRTRCRRRGKQMISRCLMLPVCHLFGGATGAVAAAAARAGAAELRAGGVQEERVLEKERRESNAGGATEDRREVPVSHIRSVHRHASKEMINRCLMLPMCHLFGCAARRAWVATGGVADTELMLEFIRSVRGCAVSRH